MYYELIALSVACLMAPWFARLAGYETHRKPFDLVGIAGIFFLLGSSFSLGATMVTWLVGIDKVLISLSFILGWIMLTVGALWGTLEVLREPEHMMHRV